MKRNKKHENRVKKLIVGCGLCAIVLSVSTYAWFIGMKTVNVSSFDVSIAAADSLYLSLDGEDWKTTLEVNSTNYSTAAYTGNTNSWATKGLIPMSTVGNIDDEASRLVLFEKGSLTATPGGYRLMASQVENGLDEDDVLNDEQDGYVAFDLFIKNLSGTEYYETFNVLNEEAIYLTTDSEVKVGSSGVANTGIENSVRVAFAEIGRVIATKGTVDDTKDADLALIRGISCTSTDSDITTICSKKTAQIWEPNDTAHVQNAINWYETSCKARYGADLTALAAYQTEDEDGNTITNACGTVENGTAYDTYAVASVINHTDQVDVYDGEDYNGYDASITAGKLKAYDYFTDTEKNYTGTARPEFITLAPNSITKVRVYIYIEGQDIDNYDFASLGKQISVAFGFTKERFIDTDVSYDDTDTATLPDHLVNKNPTTTPADDTTTQE